MIFIKCDPIDNFTNLRLPLVTVIREWKTGRNTQISMTLRVCWQRDAKHISRINDIWVGDVISLILQLWTTGVFLTVAVSTELHMNKIGLLWGHSHIELRLIEVEIDWSWCWLKLRLIEFEVDWSWSYLPWCDIHTLRCQRGKSLLYVGWALDWMNGVF